MEIHFHCRLDSNIVIATKFLYMAWQLGCLAYAKICCNLMSSNGIIAKRSFHRIWIAGKKSLVKRAPDAWLGWRRCSDTPRPRQNGCHFADYIFKYIFLNESRYIFIEISLKFVPKGPNDNDIALVQIMGCCQKGGRPLSEPMMA